MNNTKMVWLLSLVAILSCPQDLSAQTNKSHSDFAEIIRQDNPDVPDQMVAEILEIRNRLGSRLDLRLEESVAKAGVVFSADLVELVESNSASADIFSTAIQAISSDPLDPVVAGKQVTKLRSVARKMDDLAADLEDLNLFQDADKIRAQALKIRNQARTAVAPGRFEIR